jgi:hypothetical protein
MNAVFGNDIVKLDVADLEVGPTAGRHRWFPFKIAAVGLIAAAFITLMLKPNDTRAGRQRSTPVTGCTRRGSGRDGS